MSLPSVSCFCCLQPLAVYKYCPCYRAEFSELICILRVACFLNHPLLCGTLTNLFCVALSLVLWFLAYALAEGTLKNWPSLCFLVCKMEALGKTRQRLGDCHEYKTG